VLLFHQCAIKLKLKLDCSHWTGQAWSQGQQLKDWSQYSRASRLKKHIIQDRGHKCENCQLEKWQNHIIPLELHHKNSDRTNNDPSNLELLCPNCHFLTKGFRNRLPKARTKEQELIKYNEYTQDSCQCGKVKRKTSRRCIFCSNKNRKNLSKINFLTKEQLHWFSWNYPKTQLFKLWGITGNAIKKQCIKHGIKGPGNGYWQKYKEGYITDYQI
jgi:hypothetical protein